MQWKMTYYSRKFSKKGERKEIKKQLKLDNKHGELNSDGDKR
jgi:hypothetical protein